MLMIRVISIFILLAILGWSSISRADDDPVRENLLQAALDSIGFAVSDLGFRPKGYWNRFPTDIPYKLKSFDDLFAEPLKLYDYGKSFAGAVKKFCDPVRRDSLDDNLYNLVYFLGVEKKLGGFRSYGANLIEPSQSDYPFIDAVESLYLRAGEKTSFVTFGKKADWPDLQKELKEKIAPLPYPVRKVIASIIVNLREAIYWRELSIRNVSQENRNKIFYIRDLSETQGDGMVYYPEIEDAAQNIDFESMAYSALKIAATAEKAVARLTRIDSLVTLSNDIASDYSLDFPTPYGRIVIKGRDDNRIEGNNCLLILDLGGDDTYLGSVAATSRPDHGISLAIDLEGNDKYQPGQIDAPSCGAGILGVGLLYDASGSDRYQGKVFSQGAGFLGIGILFDGGGSDNYRAETSAQGAAYFGIGLAIDAVGDDEYYLHGDGQGMGGVGGGVGCLADFSGDDLYTAEPSSEVVNRGDYHSEFKINANNAQGAGFGRRGDGSDGHAWAGGLGAIIDIHGNDKYVSGNWSLGCGYWFATGICYDGDGDDEYSSVYFTQGSGAHFCNGILIDEAGNDKHILYETAGAALGFGWDYTNALFIDRAGDDHYEAKMISYGLAQIRSFAFFFDMGGADTYVYKSGQQGFGAATFRENYARPDELMTYYYYSKSAGIFIDASGTDLYLIKDDENETPSLKFKDNHSWFTPEKTDSTYGYNNFGIGLDTENGFIPELEIFDER